MELRALKSFVWIADLGSISRAAAELNIVQSALSRQVQQIEAELGTALFTRLPRGVQLTLAGRQFLEHAREILREVDQAKSAIKRQPAALKGSVALGISPTLAPVVAPGCVERAARDLPGVTLTVVESFSPALRDRLMNGQLDLALLTNPPPSPMLRLEPLLAEQIVVVTPPQLRGVGQFYTLEELCRTPLVLTSGLRAMVEEQLRKYGRELSPPTEVNSVEAIRRLLLRGHGVTLMPISAFREELRTGRLDAFPIVDVNLQRQLVMTSTSRPTRVVEQVAHVVRQEISELAASGVFSPVSATQNGKARAEAASPPPRRKRRS
jgi:LysR family nitrogen assimilation transcriptional regulator